MAVRRHSLTWRYWILDTGRHATVGFGSEGTSQREPEREHCSRCLGSSSSSRLISACRRRPSHAVARCDAVKPRRVHGRRVLLLNATCGTTNLMATLAHNPAPGSLVVALPHTWMVAPLHLVALLPLWPCVAQMPPLQPSHQPHADSTSFLQRDVHATWRSSSAQPGGRSE